MQRQMLKKDFIKNIQEYIAFLKQWSEGRSKNALVNHEDSHSLSQLEALLKSYEESTILATSGTLKPFVTFLRDRWEMVKDTDADYLHAPKTIIDAVCKYLAEELSNYTDQSALSLLIPTLKSESVAHIPAKKLHEYVLSDDGTQLLNAYDFARRQNNKSLRDLNDHYSSAEKARMISKTEKIRAFHQALEVDSAEGYTLAAPKAKAKFNRHLLSTSVAVSSTGAEGNLRLRKEMHPAAASLSELNQIMRDYPQQDMAQFLDTFSTADLRALLLNGKKFQTALADQSLYVGDERQAKQVLLAFVVLYTQELNARTASHKSTSGWLFGKPSKEVKQPAADLFRDLLSSDLSLAEIDKKLDESKEHAAALNDASLFGYVTSDLAALRNQIKVVMDPAYREEITHSYSWFSRKTASI